jgi:hypothetical protein
MVIDSYIYVPSSQRVCKFFQICRYPHNPQHCCVYMALSLNTVQDMPTIRREQYFPMSLHFCCTFASGTCRWLAHHSHHFTVLTGVYIQNSILPLHASMPSPTAIRFCVLHMNKVYLLKCPEILGHFYWGDMYCSVIAVVAAEERQSN